MNKVLRPGNLVHFVAKYLLGTSKEENGDKGLLHGRIGTCVVSKYGAFLCFLELCKDRLLASIVYNTAYLVFLWFFENFLNHMPLIMI